ncbi:MAG: hypothetical protein IH582_10700 [Afipia sp.]|nr:hypothetical protein [Afipia sp.]
MADVALFPVTVEAIVRLEAAALAGKPRMARQNRLRAICKATTIAAVAEGETLLSALAIAKRHLAAIKARIDEIEQDAAFEERPMPVSAIGGAA